MRRRIEGLDDVIECFKYKFIDEGKKQKSQTAQGAVEAEAAEPSEGVAGAGRRDADVAAPVPKWYEEIEDREDEIPEHYFRDVSSAKSISSDDEQTELESSLSCSDDDDKDEEGEDEVARSMETLESMGFCDRQHNEELMIKYGNDLDLVIEEVVQDQSQVVDDKSAERGVTGACALELQPDRDASPGAAGLQDAIGLHDERMSCLPESVKMCVKKFDEFRFRVLPGTKMYQKEVANFFCPSRFVYQDEVAKGRSDGLEEHDWSYELDSLRQTQDPRMDGKTLSSVLSIWQAVG